jgi:hypothetical protein
MSGNQEPVFFKKSLTFSALSSPGTDVMILKIFSQKFLAER